MKNKKGFTLIELLAVIVILAIIALIAVPIILNMINQANKSAAKSSALGYIDAIEYNNGFAQLEKAGYIEITGEDLDVTEITVKLKGKKPTSGTVTINDKGKVTSADNLCFNGYAVDYDGKDAKVVGKCNSNNDNDEQASDTSEPDSTIQAYEAGDAVYFDPVTTNTCNESVFNINTIKNGTSTCYKWYVITTNDNTSKSNITLQLDHNIVNISMWSTSTNSQGPGALTNLANATATWTRVSPLTNYVYDTSEETENYGVLTCTNGICNKTVDNNTTLVAGSVNKPVRARMITGEEIKAISEFAGGTPTWTKTSGYGDAYNISSGKKDPGDSTQIDKVKWLFDNTRGNSRSNATYNVYTDTNSGYWTLTPISNYYTSVWCVESDGDLGDCKVTSGNNIGLRPVITIDKNSLVYNYTYLSKNKSVEAGSNKTVMVNDSGKYKLEVWGASGGNDNPSSTYTSTGGYGAYSIGYVNLNKDDILYVTVGNQAQNCLSSSCGTTIGGYNGGANGYNGGSGGGATHIATASGKLKLLADNKSSILIVAGGGGGANADTDRSGYNTNGGNAGGFKGGHATQIEGSCNSNCTKYDYPSGGTQENGGLGVTNWSSGATSSTQYVGTFGQGAIGTSNYGGGGGGYYGGASGQHNAGGGGSGYLSSTLSNAAMYCYDCEESNEPATKTIKNNQVSENPEPMKSKIGNGYAKITYISE